MTRMAKKAAFAFCREVITGVSFAADAAWNPGQPGHYERLPLFACPTLPGSRRCKDASHPAVCIAQGV